jgi:sporulation integral membrane protein YtvI
VEAQNSKKKSFIINTAFYALIGLIVFTTLKYLLPLVSPFIFGLLIAYALRKPTRYLASRIKLPYKPASAIVVLFFYVGLGFIISLIGANLVSMIASLVLEMPSVYEEQLRPFLITTYHSVEQIIFNLNPAIQEVLRDNFDKLVGYIGENITNISLGIVGVLSRIASMLPNLLIKTLLMVVSTFFIAADFDALMSFVLRQFSNKGANLVISIKEYLKGTLLVVVKSYGIIMSLTFLELSCGFILIDIPNPILLAMIIAVFDILPLLGTGGIMVPWVVFNLVIGSYGRALALFVLYATVTIIRNIVEPKIVGSQLGIHPIAALISMFIGATFFGFIGLFGFPITLSLLSHLNKNGMIKVFK